MQQDRAYGLYSLVPVLLSLTGYLFFGYVLERHQTLPVFLGYTGLFSAYLLLYRQAATYGLSKWHYGLALAARLCLLFSIPTLSDDVYRFVWDGNLLAHGLDPFAFTPEQYMQGGSLPEGAIFTELYPHLNSPGYFTIYPPLCQGVFYLSALLGRGNIAGSILVIRLFILLAEGITLFVLPRLLRLYRLPAHTALLYALNPLVILELSGSLHFEAWAIAGLLSCLYLWKRHKSLSAGLAMAAAVLAKLLPLITLPLFLGRGSFVRNAIFFATTGLAIMLALLPYLDSELIEGMRESTALYYSRFEFNASLYYVVRTVGYWYKGYNIIGVAGSTLALVAGVGIWVFAALEIKYRMRLPVAMMWVYGIYYVCVTTLHPWYVVMLLPLCLFGRWRFPVVWTATVFLTYAGYTESGYRENLWLVAIEYTLVFGYLTYEVWQNRKGMLRGRIIPGQL